MNGWIYCSVVCIASDKSILWHRIFQSKILPSKIFLSNVISFPLFGIRLLGYLLHLAELFFGRGRGWCRKNWPNNRLVPPLRLAPPGKCWIRPRTPLQINTCTQLIEFKGSQYWFKVVQCFQNGREVFSKNGFYVGISGSGGR